MFSCEGSSAELCQKTVLVHIESCLTPVCSCLSLETLYFLFMKRGKENAYWLSEY